MKHCLLVFAAVLALAISVPASAQYMFIDTNRDGFCTSSDVLTSGTDSVDVWLVTNQDKNGNPVLCPSGEPLSMSSYTFILSAPGSGVGYSNTPVGSFGWSDRVGFSANAGGGQAGNDVWIAKFGGGVILPPGKYWLGTLDVTVTGSNPTLQVVASTSIDATAITSFGSNCAGPVFDYTMTLGRDWNDVCGTASATPTSETTWGKIKAMYR